MGPLSNEYLVANNVVGLPNVSKLSNDQLHEQLIISPSYFPPPVLEVLNNKQLEAAKRGGTSALDAIFSGADFSRLQP